MKISVKYAVTSALSGAANGFFAAGGVLAGKLFGRVKADWLRRAFGVLILYGGIRAVLLL